MEQLIDGSEKRWPRQFWSFWAPLSILSLFIYLPAFLTIYGLHNDYSFLGTDKTELWSGFPESLHLIAVGRPLGALLLNVQGLFATSLPAFSGLRFFTYLCSLLIGYMLGRHLALRLRVRPFLCASMAFCLLMLPPTQVYITWLTNFVPGTLNLLVASFAYVLLDRFALNAPKPAESVALGAAFLLFLSALFIYPPTALFILVFTCSNVLFSPHEAWPKIRLTVVRDLLFVGLGMIGYFLLNYFWLLPLFRARGSEAYQRELADIEQGGTYRFELAVNIWTKLSHFLELSAIAFGNFLHVIVGDSAWFFILPLVMTGIALVLIDSTVRAKANTNGRQRSLWAGERIVACVIITVASCAPSLLASGGDVGYRILMVYEVIVVLVLFFPLHYLLARDERRIRLVAYSLVSAVCLCFAVCAGINVLATSENAGRELAFVREKLGAADRQSLTTVIGLLSPGKGLNFTEMPLQLDFEFQSGGIPFAALVRALAGPMGFQAPRLAVLQLFNPAPIFGSLVLDKGSLLIDLNDARPDGQHPFGIIQSLQIETSNGVGGRVLFDHDQESFWEASGTAWVKASSPVRHVLHKYAFLSGATDETAGMMPDAWQVLASNGGVNWTEIDARDGEKSWQPNQARTYSVRALMSADQFLFVFKGTSEARIRIYEIGMDAQ